MTFHHIRSNQVEILFEHLAHELSSDPLPVFQAEWVVTQNQGMTKWLTLQLAQRLGVWANNQNFFPRQLIEQSLFLLLGERLWAEDRWGTESLTLEIYSILVQEPLEGDLSPLKEYVFQQPSSLSRLELAQKIADCFDQYFVYRPDWIEEFEQKNRPAGISGHWEWQKALFLRLRDRLGPNPLAFAAGRFSGISGRPPGLTGFPKRISIFGVSSLPPGFIQLIYQISKYTELFLYTLTPTEDYWGEVNAPKQWLQKAVSAEQRKQIFEEQYFTQANPLLSFVGQMGQEYQALLTELCPEVELHDQFYWQEPDSLLTHLQKQLSVVSELPSSPVSLKFDRSIQVFKAHSKIREVETAKNQILLALQEDPALEAKDFLVMCFDLEAYAPLIEGVFKKAPFLPHSITDQGPGEINPILGQVYALLSNPEQRWELSSLLDWLRLEQVQHRFHFSPSTVDWFAELFASAQIRWGLNQAQKGQFGQPAELQNTWDFGLQRILLGYAMEPELIFEDLSPLEGVEGNEFGILSGFFEFFESLKTLLLNLQGEKTLSAWVDQLNQLVLWLFEEQNQEGAHQQELLELIAKLARFENRNLTLDSQGLSCFLQQLSSSTETAQGFLNQGVTFSAMRPMRTVPFAHVMMLGLSFQFPTQVTPPSFDLIHQQKRMGDRSKKEDDKYLFLEAILAARQRLTLSYVGLNPDSGTEQAPSVVLTELLGFLDRQFLMENQPPSQQICVDLPLLPFDARCFDPTQPALANFDPSDQQSALATSQQPTFPLDVSAQPNRPTTVDLTQLKSFFKDPLVGFFRQGLGLEFRDFSVELVEREPQELDPLERYQVNNLVIQGLQQGCSKERLYQQLKGQGLLPYAGIGRRTFEALFQQTEEPFACWQQLTQGPVARKQVSGQLGVQQNILTGETARSPRVTWIPSALKGKQLLAFWLDHLFANHLLGPTESHLVGGKKTQSQPGVVRWEPVDNPVFELSKLVELYFRGLGRPLPLFPDLSLEYWKNNRFEPLKSGWERSLGYGALTELLERAYGTTHPLFDPACLAEQKEFADLSAQIFTPMMKSMEVIQ